MSHRDELLRANAAYTAAFEHGDLARPPQKRLAILTCMDARIDPAAVFGLEPGDAHVLRNAGGRVSDDVVRSLAISSHLLGTRTVLVVHHSACGMQGTDEDLREALASAAGEDPGDLELLAFDDLEQSVREDVAALREHRLLGELEVHGFVLEIDTGRLRRID